MFEGSDPIAEAVALLTSRGHIVAVAVRARRAHGRAAAQGHPGPHPGGADVRVGDGRSICRAAGIPGRERGLEAAPVLARLQADGLAAQAVDGGRPRWRVPR